MKFPRLLAAAALLALGPHPAVAAPQPPPPRLVVAILVDQLRYDYLERLHEHFSPRGFRLLMEEGAFLTFAHYDYAQTVTGPGHASFLSGAPPSVHGIIGNDWFDKRTGKMTNCVSDLSVTGVGTDAKEAQRSPRNFIGSTLADEFRLRFGGKIVGVSLKDRGAILPAGKQPNGAYWFDSGTGNFVTSTYYMAELPPWVQAFNARKRPAEFIGQTWSRLLDPRLYAFTDEGAGEGSMPGERTPTFDHTVNPSPTEGFETLVPTPFGNQLLAEFALAAIDGEQLGTDAQPDFLSISFSSVDAAGHRFGPYSHEAQDMILRLDRDLEALWQTLDEKVGLKNVLIVLTADHGVAPTPEFAAAQGLDGQRTDAVTLMADLLGKMVARFGPGSYLLRQSGVDGSLFYNHETLRQKQLDPEVLSAFIRDWALETGRYQAVYSRGQLLEGRAPGALGRLVAAGFHAERSGDIVLISKPYILPLGGKIGTTHGSPYTYDSHVPVLFYGRAFKPGRYPDPFAITDIAATLSVALRMNEPSGSIGKPLVRLFAETTEAKGATAEPRVPAAEVKAPAPGAPKKRR